MIDNKDPMRNVHQTPRRVKLTGADHAVQMSEPNTPAGRSYRSSSYVSPASGHLHVLSSAGNSPTPLIINLTVSPTESPISNFDVGVPYELLTRYLNHTSKNIKITDRNNFTFTLPKIKFWNPTMQEYLIVRRVHRFGNADTAISILHNHQIDGRYLSVENGERDALIRRIEEGQRQGEFRATSTNLEITVDRIIPVKLLEEHPGLYVSDLDVMFRLEHIDLGTPHPTSVDAVLQGEILEKISDIPVTGAFYEIVDNESRYGTRYICIGTRVMALPTRRDPGRESGIYHTYVDNDNLKIQLSFSSLDKAESMGIYQTREDAETRGQLNDTNKIELLRLDQQNKKLDADLRRQDIELKSAQRERDAALAAMQHDSKMELVESERLATLSKALSGVQADYAKLEKQLISDRIETRSLYRHDHFDELSARRKNTSEILKWAPTAVTAVIGLYTAINIHRSQSRD